MTTKDASFPPRVLLGIHPYWGIIHCPEGANDSHERMGYKIAPYVPEHLLSALREENARLREALEQAEAARAEGEEIGRLKQRLEYAEFKASDPGEHHAIRTMARETIAEIKAKLEALAPKGEVK